MSVANLPAAGRRVGAAAASGEQAVAIRTQRVTSLVDHNAVRKAQDATRAANMAAHRAMIEGGYTPPIYRVAIQQQAIKVRGTCPYADCGGTAFDLDLPPMILDRPAVNAHGAILCLLCSRTVAVLKIGEGMTPAQFRASGEPLRGRGRPPKGQAP